MSDQPNPTTSEWTAGTVERLYGRALNPIWCQPVADAHNAELAAAYEKGMTGGIKATGLALAAERKDHTERVNSLTDFYSHQLAAERKKVAELEERLHKYEA